MQAAGPPRQAGHLAHQSSQAQQGKDALEQLSSALPTSPHSSPPTPKTRPTPTRSPSAPASPYLPKGWAAGLQDLSPQQPSTGTRGQGPPGRPKPGSRSGTPRRGGTRRNRAAIGCWREGAGPRCGDCREEAGPGPGAGLAEVRWDGCRWGRGRDHDGGNDKRSKTGKQSLGTVGGRAPSYGI